MATEQPHLAQVVCSFFFYLAALGLRMTWPSLKASTMEHKRPIYAQPHSVPSEVLMVLPLRVQFPSTAYPLSWSLGPPVGPLTQPSSVLQWGEGVALEGSHSTWAVAGITK